MKAVTCLACCKVLDKNEVALNQRLLGIQLGAFRCIDCLAQKLDMPPAYLQNLIFYFKETGCTYFSRLMEDS